MLAGLLLPLVPGVAIAAEEQSASPAAIESAGARTLEKLKDKDDVAPSIDSAPAPTIAPPGDPAQVLPPGPTQPDWQAGKELVGRRTATTKAFTGRVPGEIETRLYGEPIHYKQGDFWTTIDSSLKPSEDGKHKNKANDFDLQLAELADDAALAELVLDSTHSVGFGLDKAAKVKGKPAKNSVTYSKVQKDTDVRLTSTKAGVKEELILASPDAPDRFVFPLKLKALTASIDELGDVVYKDSKGTERARTPHGYMFDSNLDPLSDEPATSTGVTYALIAHGKGTALEVTLDREWMDSKDRIYPIIVDPEIHRGTWGDDTFVMNPYVNDYSSSTELKVGSFNGGANKARSFMHFDTGALPGTVTYAELQMRELHSYNCGAPPEAIFRVNIGWVGSTMRSFPGASYDPSGTLGWWVNGGCPSRLAAWNVTGMVQHFQNIGETMGSFAAVATQETNSNQWKKYRSSQAGDGPLLKVFTNYPPVTPWAVTPVNNQRVFTANVPVSAAYADGDGTPGYIALGVWDTAGTMVWAQWSGLQSNYTIANATTSALADGWYRISTIAWDGQLYSAAWSADQWFRVDTRRPELTLVTPTAGSTVGSTFPVSARYTESYGYAGEVLFAVNRLDGTGETHAWSQPVSQGQTATANLTITQPGQYDFYAIGNDGNRDANAYGAAWSGPYRIIVAAAPGIPSNVTAEPGPASAKIKWTVPSNGGSAITAYDITAADLTSPGTTVPPQRCSTGCSPTSGFAFDGLIPTHSFTFKVSATNAFGTSNLSSASAAVTVRATPDYVDEVQVSPGDQQVTLTWEAEFLATSYRIRTYQGNRPPDGVANEAHFVNEKIADPADTTETISGLKNGNHYYFTVTPVVLLLLSGPPTVGSDEVVPFGTPFAPAHVAVFSGNNAASVLWSPPGSTGTGIPGDNGSPITAYRVKALIGTEMEEVVSVDVGAEPHTVTITGLQNGTNHTFSVQAINVAGPGAAATTSSSAIPGGAPFKPENVTADPGVRSSLVTWEPPSERPDGTPGDQGSPITGYRVSISPPCVSCAGTTVASGSSTSTNVTGLIPGTTYSFRVAASNAVGQGPYSEPSTQLAMPAEVPDPPSNVVAHWDANAPQLRVTWETPASNGSPITGYKITRQPGGVETLTTETTTEYSGLDPNFSYSFRIRATNAVGDSIPSDPSNSAGAPSLVPSITIETVEAGDRVVNVEWDSPAGDSQAFGFGIKAYRSVEGIRQLAKEVVVGPATHARVELEAGEYYIAVRGFNAAGEREIEFAERVTVWNEPEVDQWQFEYDMEEFLQIRKLNPYPYSFGSDLCSVPPEYAWLTLLYDQIFQDACKRHDFGSQNYGRRLHIRRTEETRNAINAVFRDDMIDACVNAFPGPGLASARAGCTTEALAFYGLVSSPPGRDGFYPDESFTWESGIDNAEP